jgi:DNA-binding CsgD family transcriptional regulator
MLGVSHPTILGDLKALGIARARACPRPKYPLADERPCSHCGSPFTPPNNKPTRRFCSAHCSDAARAERTIPTMTLKERRERALLLYARGLSYSEVAAELGIDAMTVWRDVRAAGGESRPAHRRRRVVRVVSPTGAEDERLPSLAERYRFLGPADWARFRWDHRFDPAMNLEPLMRAGWPGRARQRNLGRMHADKPPSIGARPRGRPAAELTAAQRAEVQLLQTQRWGRRAIARRLGVSERAVRNAFSE